jgi:hypothetical protein
MTARSVMISVGGVVKWYDEDRWVSLMRGACIGIMGGG